MKSLCYCFAFVTIFSMQPVLLADEAVKVEEPAKAAKEVDKAKPVLFKNKDVQKEIYYKVVGNKRDPFYAPGELEVVDVKPVFTKKQIIDTITAKLGIVGRGPNPVCRVKGPTGKLKVFVGDSFKLKIGSDDVEVKVVEIKASASEGIVFQIGEKTYTVKK